MGADRAVMLEPDKCRGQAAAGQDLGHCTEGAEVGPQAAGLRRGRDAVQARSGQRIQMRGRNRLQAVHSHSRWVQNGLGYPPGPVDCRCRGHLADPGTERTALQIPVTREASDA